MAAEQPIRPESYDFEAGATRIPPNNTSPGQSMFTAIALGFPGLLLLIFGLPMSVALPIGVIVGWKRMDLVAVLGLLCVTFFGAVLVYGAWLLLRSAVRAYKNI